MKKSNPSSADIHTKSVPFLFRILWGMFLFILLILPVLNHLIQVVPLQQLQNNGILVWYSSDLFTALAVIANGAMIIRLFQVFRFSAAEDHKVLREKILNTLGFSVLILVTYLALAVTLRDQMTGLHLGQNNSQQLYIESVVLILYILFFSLVCRACYLLGIRFIPLNRKASRSLP